MALRLRIKELLTEKSMREGKKISANKLAVQIGVSHNTIQTYLEDKSLRPDLRILEKLQDYFECSIEELFEREQTVKAITRITFAVNDMEKMVTFYNAALDANLTQIGDSPFYIGKLAGLELLMCPNEIANVNAEQNRHQFRFEVIQIESVLAAITKVGGEQLGEIQVENNTKRCGARDPEGNTMEFISYF